MEYITFKENGTVQEEIKNRNSFVMLNASLRRRLDFINAIKKEYYKIHITVSAFIIENIAILNGLVTMVNRNSSTRLCRCWNENHHITNSCVVYTILEALNSGAGGLIRAYAGSVAHSSSDWTGRNQRQWFLESHFLIPNTKSLLIS